jgi:hypothetical protein
VVVGVDTSLLDLSRVVRCNLIPSTLAASCLKKVGLTCTQEQSHDLYTFQREQGSMDKAKGGEELGGWRKWISKADPKTLSRYVVTSGASLTGQD